MNPTGFSEPIRPFQQSRRIRIFFCPKFLFLRHNNAPPMMNSV